MKIKHLVFLTESHKVFLQNFINTFQFDSDIDLIIRYAPQECKSGVYHSNDWKKIMKRRVECFIEFFSELEPNDVFISSDIDLIFIRPYKEALLQELATHDGCFQWNVEKCGLGFFICKVNEKIKSLFQDVYAHMDSFADEEICMNSLLDNRSLLKNPNVDVKILSHKFFSYGLSKFGQFYNGEDHIELPDDMIIFHANFTIGIENKIKLIKLAMKKING